MERDYKPPVIIDRLLFYGLLVGAVAIGVLSGSWIEPSMQPNEHRRTGMRLGCTEDEIAIPEFSNTLGTFKCVHVENVTINDDTIVINP